MGKGSVGGRMLNLGIFTFYFGVGGWMRLFSGRLFFFRCRFCFVRWKRGLNLVLFFLEGFSELSRVLRGR